MEITVAYFPRCAARLSASVGAEIFNFDAPARTWLHKSFRRPRRILRPSYKPKRNCGAKLQEEQPPRMSLSGKGNGKVKGVNRSWRANLVVVTG
jgi:hypothetical protein